MKTTISKARRKCKPALAPLAAIFVITIAHARPTSNAEAVTLLEKSDIVVVGRVTSVAMAKPMPPMMTDGTMFDQIATIKVTSYLTAPLGTKRNDITVHIQSYHMVDNHAFAIFFLKEGRDGRIRNADDDGWALPALQDFPARTNPAPSPMEAVARELTQILSMPPSKLIDPAHGVNFAMQAIWFGSGQIYELAADGLWRMPTPLLDAKLRPVAGGQLVPGNLWAASVMMQSGIYDVLPALVPLLTSPAPGTQSAANAVARAIGYRNDIPAALTPSLIRLLGSTDPWVRGNVGETLGRMGDPAICPALVAAIERETDETALHDEISSLCRLVHDSSPECRQVTYIGWPKKSPAYWRDWAQRQLGMTLHTTKMR